METALASARDYAEEEEYLKALREIRRALEEGVRLKGLSEYYMERRERCGDNCVILGYASLRDGEIGALAEALGRAWGRE